MANAKTAAAIADAALLEAKAASVDAQAAAIEEAAGGGDPQTTKPFERPRASEAIGDVTVIVRKTLEGVRCGSRVYSGKRGSEILMDAGHAHELAQGEWVSVINVIPQAPSAE